MKSIESKIREIAAEIGINYVYDDWQRVNYRMERTPLPVMVNILPVSGSFVPTNMGQNLSLRANCMVGFLDKTQFDFDSTENDEIVDRMIDYAAAFVMSVNESGDFEPLREDNMTLRMTYDKLDVNLTGVVLEMQLQTAHGYCVSRLPQLIRKLKDGNAND